MYIEGLNLKNDSVSAGDTLEIEVLLRPYRKKQVKKTFQLKIPSDASGVCEVLVRGGGIEPLNQSAIIQGWKTIENFKQLFTEISALETNRVIIEFNYERSGRRGTPTTRSLSMRAGASKETKRRRLKTEPPDFQVGLRG